MNERKETPMNLIGQLPLAPPDPLGSTLWHSQNEGDVLLRNDQLLNEFFTPLLKFALPSIGPVREASKEKKEVTSEEGEETEEEEEEKEEAEELFLTKRREEAALEI